MIEDRLRDLEGKWPLSAREAGRALGVTARAAAAAMKRGGWRRARAGKCWVPPGYDPDANPCQRRGGT